MDLAWGCKPHTGWAIAVLVGGTAGAPVVLDRRRVQLCPDELPRMAYHAAQELPHERAAELLAEVDRAVTLMTADVLADLVVGAAAHGNLVALALVGRPRAVPPLATALANHAMLHSSEGELYRGALDEAARALGLPVHAAPPKRTVEEAAPVLGTTGEVLAARLAALRAHLGSPWQADHKDATAAALMALAFTA